MVAALAAATGLMLTGCGEDDPAAVEPVEEVIEDEPSAEEPETPPGDLAEPAFDGPYGEGFLIDAEAYLDLPVVLSGEVADVLTDGVFAMAAAEEPGVTPILVVSGDPLPEVESGVPVTVTGTLQDPVEVGEVGQVPDFALNDPLFEDYAGAPLVFAESVEVSPAGG